MKLNLKKKKRILILTGFCLLLVVTGVVNILLNNYVVNDSVNANAIMTAGNFFTNYRSDRTTTREQEILYLDAIIASNASSAEAIKSAETQKEAIIKTMEAELFIESLIKAKGFEDAVVSCQNSNVSVIIKKAELNTSEVAQIVEIVQSQTGLDLDNIKIIPVE